MAAKLGKQKTRFKIQRALQVELPGLGKAGALERRGYPPGQHGHARRKLSGYSIQLREKQKLKFHYGLREEQLKRLVREAKRGKAHKTDTWMDRLVQDLELRADNIVFRLGFARSIPAARQLVRHGKVFVNGRKVSIPSQVLRVKDAVTLAPGAYTNASVLLARQNPRLPLPNYLSLESQGGVDTGLISARPLGGDIPFDFSGRIVTEYFSGI
jgi:small subunit ribosomal protein S4